MRTKEVVHSPQATHGAVSVGFAVSPPECLVAFSDHISEISNGVFLCQSAKDVSITCL